MRMKPSSVLEAESIGPVDLAVLIFDSAPVPDDIGDAISDLVHTETVRVIDLALVNAAPGAQHDIEDISDSLHGSGFDELADSKFDLLTDEDLALIAGALPSGSTALVVVWENTWAATLGQKIRDGGGRLAVFERLQHDDVTSAIAVLVAGEEEG